MSEQPIILQKSEWIIMEKLWAKHPQSIMQLYHALREETGWSKSTVNTLLSRMVGKGILLCREGEKARGYDPAIEREEAAMNETDSLLKRVYNGSVSLMMSTLTRHQALSREEIEELQKLLSQLEDA